MKSIGDEINLLKNLRNRYIIQYYSLFKDEQELMIIMELADHGSLDKFIKSNQSQPHN
jgi:serine/threonine protein kinase